MTPRPRGTGRPPGRTARGPAPGLRAADVPLTRPRLRAFAVPSPEGSAA